MPYRSVRAYFEQDGNVRADRSKFKSCFKQKPGMIPWDPAEYARPLDWAGVFKGRLSGGEAPV